MSAQSKAQPIGSPKLLREMLLRLQDQTYQRIKDFRRAQEQESSRDPGDEMDSANTTEEVETHAGLIAREEEKLKFLDEALARLDAGIYGKCLGCGEPIPLERLQALPFASYCVHCQEGQNRAKFGWGEGTTIPPYDHQWTVPEEMGVPEGREYQSTDPEEHLTIRASEPLESGEPKGQSKGGGQAKHQALAAKDKHKALHGQFNPTKPKR